MSSNGPGNFSSSAVTATVPTLPEPPGINLVLNRPVSGDSQDPDPRYIGLKGPRPPREEIRKRSCPQCKLVVSSERALVIHLASHNGKDDHVLFMPLNCF